MSKIEIDLKDSFEIIEDGVTYQVPVYEVDSEGLKQVEDTGMENDPFQNQEISFVRGSKRGEDDVEPKRGTLHEHLLAVMIHDLTLKNNLVRSKETSMVITKLEEALMWQQRRSIDRVKREVQETYEE